MAPTSYPSTTSSSEQPTTSSSITTTDNSNGTSSHMTFNVSWIVIAGVLLAIVPIFSYLLCRRRLRKVNGSVDGRGTFASDTQSWGGLGPRTNAAVHRQDLGLDESGEAPPSYIAAAADKPPSMRSVEGQVSGSVDLPGEAERGVELHDLPAYDVSRHSTANEQRAGADGELQQPATAKVAGERSER